MRAPILIIHVLADRRVDPDHAYRLLAMLELHGKPHESLFVSKAEHRFDREQWILVIRRVRRFPTASLQPEIDFLQDPRSPREGRCDGPTVSWEKQ